MDNDQFTKFIVDLMRAALKDTPNLMNRKYHNVKQVALLVSDEKVLIELSDGDGDPNPTQFMFKVRDGKLVTTINTDQDFDGEPALDSYDVV